MSNCIDCEYVIMCKKANENVKKCDNFKNAHRKMVHLDMDYKNEVKEMLE